MSNLKKLRRGEFKPSYIYCRICGYTPHSHLDEPNYGPVRFWEPDDGWIIGTLCRHCIQDEGDLKPRPGDFAYDFDHIEVDNTDEDVLDALDDPPPAESIPVFLEGLRDKNLLIALSEFRAEYGLSQPEALALMRQHNFIQGEIT